jgi:ribosomal protein S30
MAGRVRKVGEKKIPLLKVKDEKHRLENDPRFLRRIEQARDSLQAGRGVRLEDVETE